jgi:hypothetical protein
MNKFQARGRVKMQYWASGGIRELGSGSERLLVACSLPLELGVNNCL